jgi:hypothetical protein
MAPTASRLPAMAMAIVVQAMSRSASALVAAVVVASGRGLA